MKLEQLEKDHIYHIYNRGNNSGDVFKSNDNYKYFLELLNKHLASYATIYAYCLLKNHYHLILKVEKDGKEVTQKISNLINAYTKAYNKSYNRTGSLFENRFKRKKITDEEYLKKSIIYVHTNARHHNLIEDFRDYPFSSYSNYFTDKAEKYILGLFDNKENFEYCHMSKFETKDNDLQDSHLQGFGNLEGVEMKDKFYSYIQNLQDTITSKLEEIDGKAKFREDLWERPEGGGGRTRVIENGSIFEKGGVNISGVHGALPKTMQSYFKVGDVDFFACGLSLVLHPKNPMVPTVHANWRYFEMYDATGNIVDSWFGGGQDLTPYYLFEEDARHFHQICKNSCDKHSPDFYTNYKEKCDTYFYNTHREEGRGIGGLFFDYCKANENMTMQKWYDFVTEVGDSFLDAYVPIVEKRKDLQYTDAQKDWQEIRRGRYVEFNLVHDKGTLFGLKTNGRIESILMSLPPNVQWRYDHHPETGSEEEKLIKVLKNPVDWV